MIVENKTVEQAVLSALTAMSADKSEVDIKVLQEPTNKLFGIITTAAKVEVKLKPITEAIRKLESIVRAMNLTVQIRVAGAVETNYTVEITGSDASKCIGKHGQVLDALQAVINASVNGVRIKLDALDYRQRRVEVLRKLAKSTAGKVLRTRKEIRLDAMSRADRKAIHEALQDNPKVESRSVGEEPNRRVIISLKPA